MIERRRSAPQTSQARPSAAPNVRRVPPSPHRVPGALQQTAGAPWASRLVSLTSRRWVPLLAVVLGLGIFGYAVFFGSTDEELIRARLSAFASAVEVKAAEQNVVIRAARIKDAFNEIFVKDVSIEIPELTDLRSGRKELVQVAAQAMSLYRTAWVDVSGLTVNIDKVGQSAVASGAVRLHATRHSGEAELDSRTVSIRLDKIEGHWRIVSVAVSASQDPEDDER
jgi:hypothetical protein